MEIPKDHGIILSRPFSSLRCDDTASLNFPVKITLHFPDKARYPIHNGFTGQSLGTSTFISAG